MEIAIQREIREACLFCKHLANDILEAYLEYAILYSKKYWLVLHSEYLRRMENEIVIC
jgi:hypothetical protein